MALHGLGICAFILTLIAALLPAVRAIDSASDRAALTELFSAAGGAEWRNNSSWMSDSVSMCSWYGVACQSGCPSSNASLVCRVVALRLSANGLRGTIAPSVQALTGLVTLDLGSNRLVGTIPPLESLVALQWLGLRSNRISGSLPALVALTQLERLDVRDNALTGTIPPFATLTKLTYLSVRTNRLTGTIPRFAALAQLLDLRLYANNLSGSIPPLDSLVTLQRLVLRSNRLGGTLPSFARLARLQVLDVSNNSIAGTIPVWSHLARLSLLSIQSNNLIGTLPLSLRSLRNLLGLSAQRNSLSGSIELFSTSPNLPPFAASYVDLSGNSFGGRVPPVAAGLPLSFLDLHGNQFACPLPAFPVSPPLVVLRSPPQCQYSVADILAYIGIGAGASVGAFLVALIVKYTVSSQQFLLASFAFWWAASAIGFVSNALSYSDTFAYLLQDSQNCPTMNEYRVFGALMPVIPNVRNASAPPGSYFSTWISDPQSGFKDTDIRINSNVIAALCARVPECAYQAR